MKRKLFSFVVLCLCMLGLCANDNPTAKAAAIQQELASFLATKKGQPHAPAIERQIQMQMGFYMLGRPLTSEEKRERYEALSKAIWENEFLAARPDYRAYVGNNKMGGFGIAIINLADDCYYDGLDFYGSFALGSDETLEDLTVRLKQNGVTLATTVPSISGNTFTGSFAANLFTEGSSYDLNLVATFRSPFGVGFFSTEVKLGNNNDFTASIAACCDITDNSLFSMQTACNNGVFTLTATAADTDPAYHVWSLHETSVPGATSGGIMVQEVGGANGPPGTATVTFTIPDVNKFYYIKHAIMDPPCYSWRESRGSVVIPKADVGIYFYDWLSIQKTTYCFGEAINMQVYGNTPVARYYIEAWRRPTGSTGSFTFHGKVDTTNGQLSSINLSLAFGNQAPPVRFEPGYEYEIRLSVANPNLCIGWATVSKRFSVICCPALFNAGFQLLVVPNIGQSSNTLSAVISNTYWIGAGATHEWYVFSRPANTNGPYTLVNSVTSTSQTQVPLWNNALYNMQYMVVHRLKTQCGEFCYVQYDCSNCPQALTANNQYQFDCQVLDSIICAAKVPNGLHGSCSRNILVWNPVQGAAGYTVEISYNDPLCCASKYPPVVIPYNVTASSLPLWSIATPPYDCFRWRVRTRCASGATSAWSNWVCHTCNESGENGEIGAEEVNGEVKPKRATLAKAAIEPRISPNPSNGDMTLSLQAPGDLIVSIDVINAQGSRIKTIARNTYKGGLFNTKLSLGAAAKGVYTIVFNTNYGTFRKKVIVQ